jgi:hypothetical protein
MTVKTRTAATKTASETVSDLIDRNVKYVEKQTKSPSANRTAFTNYCVSVNVVPLRTKAEQAAFVQGNQLTGLESNWQADRRTGKIAATVSFEDYALRSSGVKVTTEAEREALMAGLATRTNYTKFRDARNAGRLNADGSIKKAAAPAAK